MEQNTNPLFADYLLHLADDALILGHRNSEWCGHGPILEQDIAITNISLDLIGQARNFYQYAADVRADGSTEDSLAYFRDVHEFKNTLIVELPKGDWAFTIMRQFLSSNYYHLLYKYLSTSADARLAGIAAKSLKEVTYHLRWSSEWVIRLGDGTDESRQRILGSLSELWPCTAELFRAAPYQEGANDPLPLQPAWLQKVAGVFNEAGLPVPAPAITTTYAKTGNHSSHLAELLEEMQVLPRTYPDATW